MNMNINLKGPFTRLASAAPVQTAGSRTRRFLLSDEGVARDGHTILTSGIKKANYEANPVVTFGHITDSVENVIGRCVRLWVDGTKLYCDIEFMSADINPMADTVLQMIDGGFLSAVSISWIPLAWKYSTDKSRPGGIDFTSIDMVEVAVVPVPALPSALQQARAAGIDTRPFADWAANQLTKDSSIMSRASLNVISREFGSAPTHRGARPFAQAKAPNSARSTAGFESLGHYARAVISASDKRLVRAPSGANELDPTAGGFLVPDAFSDQLIGSLWEQSVIAPLVDKRETDFPENISLPAVDETSRALGSRWGGVESYFEGEGIEPPTTLMKLRGIGLKATKLVGVVICTEELIRDVPLLSSHLLRAYGAEGGAQMDRAILVGNGVGIMQGVVGAPGTVSIAKSVGQAPASIVAENLSSMWSRLVPSCRRRASWIINSDAESALANLGTAATNGMFYPQGAGGIPYPLIFGRPAYVSEFAPTLGTPGDIVVGDFSQFVVLDGGLKSAMSLDCKWLTYEGAFRFTYRFSGMPIWPAPITPFNGGATQSAFVTIQQR